MDYLSSPGNSETGLKNHSLSTEAFSESVSPMTEPILANNPHSNVGFTPEDGAASHSTPFASYLFPGVSNFPGLEPETMIASPTPLFASGFDGETPCYPTPPPLGVEDFGER